MSDRTRWFAHAAVALALALSTGAVAAERAPSGALAAAASDNDLDAVTALLGRQADINAVDEYGATALAWAARNANPQMAQALLKAGADPNVVNDYGVGPLLVAAQTGNAGLVRLLLAGGANPNLATWNKETALMHAARFGAVEVVEALVKAGADVNAREARDGQTALMWAAAAGKAPVVQALLAAKADASITTPVVSFAPAGRAGGAGGGEPGTALRSLGEVKKGGFTALLFAVQSGDEATAKALLDSGQDVDQAAADGTTPLILASYHHANPQADFPLNTEVLADLEMMELLLGAGADPNKADANGLTPLHAAAFVAHGHDHLGSLTDVPTVLRPHDAMGEQAAKMLLARGADPNLEIRSYTVQSPVGQDPRGAARYANVSPFLLAAAFNKPALLKMMLDTGKIDVDARLASGGTLLTTAVRLNYLAAVEALIAAGANVNTPDAKGETPLHLVAANRPGSGAIANALLEAGARLNVKNAEGKTPVELAAEGGGPPQRGPGGRGPPPSPTDPVIQARGVPQMTGTLAREVIAVRVAGGSFPKEQIKVSIGQRDGLAPDLQRRDQPANVAAQ